MFSICRSKIWSVSHIITLVAVPIDIADELHLLQLWYLHWCRVVDLFVSYRPNYIIFNCYMWSFFLAQHGHLTIVTGLIFGINSFTKSCHTDPYTTFLLHAWIINLTNCKHYESQTLPKVTCILPMINAETFWYSALVFLHWFVCSFLLYGKLQGTSLKLKILFGIKILFGTALFLISNS